MEVVAVQSWLHFCSSQSTFAYRPKGSTVNALMKALLYHIERLPYQWLPLFRKLSFWWTLKHHKNIVEECYWRQNSYSTQNWSASSAICWPQSKMLALSFLQVDLFQLQVNTLRRYKRHYKLQTRPGLNKAQLAEVSWLIDFCIFVIPNVLSMLANMFASYNVYSQFLCSFVHWHLRKY